MATRNQNNQNDPNVEDLAKQIDELKADVSKLVETLGAMARSEGEGLSAEMRAKAEKLRDTSADHAARAEARLSELAGEAEWLARDRPAAAMGMAAGIGFLLGLILSRR